MRRTVKSAVVAVGAAFAAAAIEKFFFAAPRWRGAPSDHFDGERFRNHERGWQTEGSFLKWMATRERGAWPDHPEAAYGPKPPELVDGGRLRVTFINHSTTLIQMDGVNILTDPVWSERVSPVSFAGPRRHRRPGIRFDDLPSIDLVLVSHNHYDHMDVATLRKIDAPIVTPLGNAALLRRHGIGGAIDLDWWESMKHANGIETTVVPARHFSARALSDRNLNLWSGFVVSGKSGHIYFAGDTGWGNHFAEIGRRFAPIRAALLPIGSYMPRWFMQPAHIDPAQAVDAHFALGARTSVAVHFGTFALGDDGEGDPVHDLHLALAERALAENGNPPFLVLDQGEGRDLP
ncbi:MAG TPA: MBL fold metallo-hydrolase [Thermoanaerobaculia bacterium]|jgi:L-ascorbate metabolism protein UlaG (beta-lactamase superfamily)|nr:MBL fold metallo-hydrolase [Thermoanaerobaculia bacterium]